MGGINPLLPRSEEEMTDDVWIMMMASYWRITSAIERKIREETEGLPEWMAEDVKRDVLATAYLEERCIWSAGMDRLMELYGVPEGLSPPEADELAPREQMVLL